jgi:RNA recognition motif-containing protein
MEFSGSRKGRPDRYFLFYNGKQCTSDLSVRYFKTGMNIYVGNLSIEITEDELKQEFAAFGQVNSVNIVANARGGRNTIYGFVEMASVSDGESAIVSLSGKLLRGSAINVIKALPLSPKRSKKPRHALSKKS